MSRRGTRSRAPASVDEFKDSDEGQRGSKKTKMGLEPKITNVIGVEGSQQILVDKSHIVAPSSENVENSTEKIEESKMNEDSGSDNYPSDATSDEKSESHDTPAYDSPNTDPSVQQKLQSLKYRHDDPWSPYQINNRVQMVLEKWGNLAPMRPDIFLFKLLESRGYDPSVIPARDYRTAPTEKQMKDYDVTLVDAVRLSDMGTLKRLHAEGRTMSACNKYSESILHMAARRSSFEVVEFILQNGGDLNIVDDYGRTPLHDACWRTNTSFDIITLLLDLNLDLIRTADIRGACPLSYVRECHWLDWCAYFFHQKEKYWEHISADATNITKEECQHHNTTALTSMQAATTPHGEKTVNTEMNVAGVEHPVVDAVTSEGSTIKTSA